MAPDTNSQLIALAPHETNAIGAMDSDFWFYLNSLDFKAVTRCSKLFVQFKYHVSLWKQSKNPNWNLRRLNPKKKKKLNK